MREIHKKTQVISRTPDQISATPFILLPLRVEEAEEKRQRSSIGVDPSFQTCFSIRNETPTSLLAWQADWLRNASHPASTIPAAASDIQQSGLPRCSFSLRSTTESLWTQKESHCPKQNTRVQPTRTIPAHGSAVDHRQGKGTSNQNRACQRLVHITFHKRPRSTSQRKGCKIARQEATARPAVKVPAGCSSMQPGLRGTSLTLEICAPVMYVPSIIR